MHLYRFPLQDAVVRGFFKTNRRPLESHTDIKVVAVTAMEVAGAMVYLHNKDIIHGVSSCRHVFVMLCFCHVR